MSTFIMPMRLLIVSHCFYRVSCHLFSAGIAKTVDIVGTISHADGSSWSGVMRDALAEAVLVLFVFGSTFGFLMKYRKGKKQGQIGKKPAYQHSAAVSPKRLDVAYKAKSLDHLVTSAKSIDNASQRPRSPTGGAATTSNVQSQRDMQKTVQVGALHTDVLVAAVRNGRAAALPQLLDQVIARVKAAPNCSINTYQDIVQQYLLSSLRACAAARCFKEGIAAYEHVASHIGTGSQAIWSLVLYSAVEAGLYDRCDLLFEKIFSQGHVSGDDIVNMVRCYLHRQDINGLNGMLAQLRSASVEVDNFTWNRSLAACASVNGGIKLAEALAADSGCKEAMDAVSYNTLMKCNAKAGRFGHCMKLWSEMSVKGLKPSEVTFGILLDACVRGKDTDKASQIFYQLCQSGIRLNAVHCTTFIKGLVDTGRVDEAAKVLDVMLQTPGAEPDLITYSTLVKAYAYSGNINGSISVLRKMLSQNVMPDEICFNSVLNGCCTSSTGQWFPAEILQVMDKLLELGMQPTTRTLSIVIKALTQSEGFSEVIRLLEDTPSRFGMQPDIRLYTQLVQACIKVRKGRKAVEAFRTMVKVAQDRGEDVDEPVGKLILHCSKCVQFDTAFRLSSAASEAGIDVDPLVLNSVRDAAMKKAKSTQAACENLPQV